MNKKKNGYWQWSVFFNPTYVYFVVVVVDSVLFLLFSTYILVLMMNKWEIERETKKRKHKHKITINFLLAFAHSRSVLYELAYSWPLRLEVSCEPFCLVFKINHILCIYRSFLSLYIHLTHNKHHYHECQSHWPRATSTLIQSAEILHIYSAFRAGLFSLYALKIRLLWYVA